VIWFLSDTHFFHKRIREFCPSRPDDWAARTVRAWRELVDEEDYLVHLGDVFFSGKARAALLFQRLPGRKILVRGNHDSGTERYYELGFERILSGREWTLLEDPCVGNIAVVCVVNDQDFVHTKDNDGVVYVSHRPVADEPTTRDPWGPYLYGHTHDTFGLDPYQPYPWGRNVCIELTRFSPISLVEILEDEKEGMCL